MCLQAHVSLGEIQTWSPTSAEVLILTTISTDAILEIMLQSAMNVHQSTIRWSLIFKFTSILHQRVNLCLESECGSYVS